MSPRLRRTVVYVLPWHSTPHYGGAEALACVSARRLAAAGATVELWTTTAHPRGEGEEPELWHFPPGDSEADGLKIRRFSCERRDTRLFHRLNARMLRGETLRPEEEAACFRNHVWSQSLRRRIHEERGHSLYIFAPYSAATTILGIPAAPQESILQPSLHNEPLARFCLVWDAFAACHHLLFNAAPDRALAEGMFEMADKRMACVGFAEPVEREPALSAELPPRVRQPYLLALGRQCENKGARQLIESYRRLLADSPFRRQLVLAGAGHVDVPPQYEEDIVNLGYVDDSVKWALLDGAAAYILPSESESLSLSMLESWLCGRPAVVNARSLAAAAHVRLSGGGLTYASYEEFRLCLELLSRESALADAMGRQGREYVQRHFGAREAIERLMRFLRDIEQWLADAALAA